MVDWFWRNQSFLFDYDYLGGVSIKQELPINERIRAREVQLIDDEGQKLGVKSLSEALDIAYDKKLDLVLVAPNVNPPVCKIMNYGKYKFEQAKRERSKEKTESLRS